MKRFLISSLVLVLSTLAIAPLVRADQVSLHNKAADLNGNGVVTLTELEQYNLDQRGGGR